MCIRDRVYPPESKSIDQTFQKNKDVNDEEYFLSKHKCIHKDQKGDDLNIGQETKGNLSSQKDCAQDTVYYNFPCFHQYPSFNVSSNASPSETGV